jgi:hypothetical protein
MYISAPILACVYACRLGARESRQVSGMGYVVITHVITLEHEIPTYLPVALCYGVHAHGICSISMERP